MTKLTTTLKAISNLLVIHILSNRLMDFLAEWRTYRKNRNYFQSFLSILQKASLKALSTDLTDPANQDQFGMILRLLQLKEMETELNPDVCVKEKKAFKDFIRDKVDKELYKEFEALENTPSNEWKSSPREVFEKIHHQASPKGLDFRNYPQLALWAKYVIFQSEIDAEKLFEEINILTERIFANLAETEEEKDLLRLAKDIVLVDSLLKLELTRSDYKEIVERNGELQPDRLIARIEDLNRRTKGDKNKLSRHIPRLTDP